MEVKSSVHSSTHALWLLLITTVVVAPLADGGSDPQAETCEHLCRSFIQVSDECFVIRNCYRFVDSDDLFWRCLIPCHELAQDCTRLCGDNYKAILQECRPQCSGNNTWQCLLDCFSRVFTLMRDSQLRLPSPNIGHFEP